MKYERIAVDLAKKNFQVCGVNEHTKVQFNKKLTPKVFIEFMAQQVPTIVVMEACYSSNFWGRVLQGMGHTVLLIPAQHVTPFVVIKMIVTMPWLLRKQASTYSFCTDKN